MDFNEYKYLELFEDVAQLNSTLYREYRIGQAKSIIRLAREKFGKLAVAFSGGKDSLVVLHLVLQEDPEPLVVFNNTTIEFPETVVYVKRLEKELGLKINIVHPEKPFFELVKEYGWASHGRRWCCGMVKDRPAENFIKKSGLNVEVTGITRYESRYRRCVKPLSIFTNSSLVRINPVYDWNDREIWDYIRSNGLPYNPLYDLKYQRIGCWCCPLNGISHYKRLRKTHPLLYNFLANYSPQHPLVCKLKFSSNVAGGGS
ncbi:MAG: phosphoadenosine phosphosulfate reductase family protein [Candidatus Micrarchaeia archaeon]